MSTLIVAGIIVGFIVFFCLLFVFINNNQKNKTMSHLLTMVSQAGSEYNLSFSSHEVLNDCIICLDGVHRKLLVFEKTGINGHKHFVIDLDLVKRCSVQKIYGSIKAGELKNSRLEQHLLKVVLRFEFNDGQQPVDVSFYDHIENNIYQLLETEQKAKHWEIILSKMLKTALRKIA